MIIYYTGTGNSRYAAQMLASLTGDELMDATELIRRKECSSIISSRPLVFVAPVYGWRVARIFDKWIRNTGFSGCNKAYFVLTCGSDMGNAEKYVRRLCRKKKFELLGVKEIVMPENYAAMFDVPDEETSERIRKTAGRVLRRVSADIIAQRPIKNRKITLADRLKSSVVNSAFYKFCISSKPFHVTDGCVGCGKCAAGCPMNSIVMKDGKPVWTGDCTHCMACLCGCPAGAVEYGRRSVGKVRYQCPEYVEPKEKAAVSDRSETDIGGKVEGEEKMASPLLRYTEDFVIPADCFDEYGNVMPSKVLSVFQDMANHHGAIMGVDFDTMLSRGLLWVVTQIKYQVCGEIKPGQPVTGRSWPLPPSRLGFEREYLLCDDEGNTLIKGTSNWAVIDTVSRHLASTAGVYPQGEHCMDKNFEEKTRRLRDFEADSEEWLICPDESHIDRNGHVNNTKYADFVTASLGGMGGAVDVFQIDYINEVMCHQPLRLSHAQTENGVMVKGVSEEDKRMFTCSVKYK